MKSKSCKVKVHSERFAVINVDEVPENVEVFAMVRDPKGITLILSESELGKVGETLGCERGFRLITFETILPFDLVGFISKPRWRKGVSVYSSSHPTRRITYSLRRRIWRRLWKFWRIWALRR